MSHPADAGTRSVESAQPPDEAALPIQGLSGQEATARRAAGQGNAAPPPTGRTYTQIVRENVFTFINNILFLLGTALVLVGRPLDALVSVSVIAVNILVSVVQEVRAKRTLDRIALLTRPTATTIRDGQERALSPDVLVIGDVLKAGAGDQIVLDGKVLSGRMRVDESQLTGESDLVPKVPGDPVYSGSFCANGGAYYEVEKVGSASLANQITTGARSFRRVLTPLQKQINLVIRIMLLIVLYLQLLLIFNALVKVVPFRESVGQATILVGLVPNGLFLSIAIAYALGAVRIVRFGALVQQANAVESLSNVDVLCLDKTGTLTANHLQVTELLPLGMELQDLKRALGAMVASATTHNKTSEAIAKAVPAEPWPLLAEVPFSSARKWSAVALDDPSSAATSSKPSRGIYAFGAPEFLQPYMTTRYGPDSADWQTLTAQARSWTDRGLRVLLIAYHPDPSLLEDRGDDSRLPDEMLPLGLVGLSDELRPEARETLTAFNAAGVSPKIISGDNPETVGALARQAGLDPDVKLVSGLEMEQMGPAAFAQAAQEATIFGRITPQQKERLVEALRDQGHYVAMIGDGVNDVLSLKKANLGIAMESGSQATRAVADIVLVNDSFAALAPAVLEGQRILNGMQNILELFLTRISTVALVIVSALVVGIFPLAVRNVSVITLLTVGIPSVMLALWARPGVYQRANLLRDLLHFVLPAAIFSSLIGLLVYYGTIILNLWTLGLTVGAPEASIQHAIINSEPFAQTALSAFLVFCGLFLVIFVEPPTEWWAGGERLSGDWKPTLLAIGLMLAYLIISAVGPLRTLFALSPLGMPYIPLIIVAVVVWLFLVRIVWRARLIERFLGIGKS
ncbi:MAG: ATPase, P-type (transporting), superfamily, subfamily [Chloroflexi bacterium]|nr:ATPase, P-type (transporting), superfamily, subfamily [Chloroflexota bacterium]